MRNDNLPESGDVGVRSRPGTVRARRGVVELAIKLGTAAKEKLQKKHLEDAQYANYPRREFTV